MKVEGPKTVKSTDVRRASKSGKSSGVEFRKSLESGGASAADKPAGVAGTGPLAAVDALLALQEAPDATAARSKGVGRAEEMLDQLEQIRRGLLLGSIPASKLEALANSVRQTREAGTDARLGAILDEIELRARVELAKLQQGA